MTSISTQFLEEKDLRAVATYLKSLDDDLREPEEAPETARMEAGEGLYFDNCAACHAADASGVPYFFAPLNTSNKLHAKDPSTAIRIILGGARAQPTETIPSMLAMPPFAWKLTDAQIADLLTYLRNSVDRRSGAVSAEAVPCNTCDGKPALPRRRRIRDRRPFGHGNDHRALHRPEIRSCR